MPDARTRLLDAALDRAATVAWERLRMVDVAADAGVSRQTVYNEFGTKEGLAEAVMEREVLRVLDGMTAELDRNPDLAPAVQAAVGWVLRFCRSHPVLTKLIDDSRHGEGSPLLPLLTTDAEAVVVPATAMLLAYAERHWPERLAVPEAPAVVDVLVRLVVSHVVLPAGDPDDVARSIAVVVDRALPV